VRVEYAQLVELFVQNGLLLLEQVVCGLTVDVAALLCSLVQLSLGEQRADLHDLGVVFWSSLLEFELLEFLVHGLLALLLQPALDLAVPLLQTLHEQFDLLDVGVLLLLVRLVHLVQHFAQLLQFL